jgi:hypothetical protein
MLTYHGHSHRMTKQPRLRACSDDVGQTGRCVSIGYSLAMQPASQVMAMADSAEATMAILQKAR